MILKNIRFYKILNSKITSFYNWGCKFLNIIFLIIAGYISNRLLTIYNLYLIASSFWIPNRDLCHVLDSKFWKYYLQIKQLNTYL